MVHSGDGIVALAFVAVESGTEADVPTFSAGHPPPPRSENGDYSTDTRNTSKMIKQINDRSFELEVTNFGPIIEARVDLRPLTVFVGPSNMGKSYLAILVYALHQVFGGAHLLGNHLRREFPTRFGYSQKFSKDVVDALSDVASSLVGDSDINDAEDPQVHGESGVVLPPLVADILRRGFKKQADTLSNEIVRCFGVGEASALVRKGQAESRLVVRRRSCDDLGLDLVEQTFSLGQREMESQTMVPSDVLIPVDLKTGGLEGRRLLDRARYLSEWRHALYKSTWRESAWEFRGFLSALGTVVSSSLIGPLRLPAFYLPASRTGIMHAHSVVVSALIASASAAGLRPAARTPMLSGVLADFLEQLIQIGQIKSRSPKMKQDLGEAIEKAILGGSIRVDRSPRINYPRFMYRPYGWENGMPLANASSMVSELAPVVLYLRHLIELGNVLIVEEPESHLHPAMQVEFTRQLAALVEAGVRVIVITHSEWLLEELANIVRRSQIPEAERNGYRSDRVALRADQVGAWLFKPKRRPKGSVVEEIRIDDSGLYPSGYDDVAHALHNDWANITDRIEAEAGS